MSDSIWKRGVPNSFRLITWGAAALVFLLPLAAMQFTEEVNWDFNDFAIFGAMLVAACGAYELATRLAAGCTEQSLASRSR